MKFENIRTFNFDGALRGMRNPHNSWDKSQSSFDIATTSCFQALVPLLATYWLSEVNGLNPDYDKMYSNMIKGIKNNAIIYENKHNGVVEYAAISPKDLKLAQKLILAGPEHRKFMRQIFVTVDITAPLYWWKEFDTYKVGTVTNSTSTMHKLASTPITIDCFEVDDNNTEKQVSEFINFLEELRIKYNGTKDMYYWKELIRWLPESFLQKRTVTMNYENLYEMCLPTQRRYHKLTEWSVDFMNFVHKLPYAEYLIFNPTSSPYEG